LGKETCWGIHQNEHQITVEYGIDHDATLSNVSIPFLAHFLQRRQYLLSRVPETVLKV
jgi:alcohol dehydrogenase YqhD (iron-dependent ADH family)